MTVLDPETAEKIGLLQVLDDAITFRLDRLNLPCPACLPDTRCADHGRDEELVTSYTDRYAAALSVVMKSLDPADVELMFRPGNATPPSVSVVGDALMARLRDLTKTGRSSLSSTTARSCSTRTALSWSSIRRSPAPGRAN